MPSERRLGLGAFVAFAFLAVFSGAAQSSSSESQRLYNQGQYEASRKAALEAIAANASDVDSYVVLCSDLLALERWADAQNYALKAYALRRDPRVTEILGEAAFNLGSNDAALKHFQNYVTAVPEGASVGRAYYFIGEIYLRLARYAHADIAFSTALQFVPGNARWWARLGWAREKANDRQGALSAYASALAIEPTLEDALLGRDRLQSSTRG
jgi:tetratricopeptide (TPR) repeat protein